MRAMGLLSFRCVRRTAVFVAVLGAFAGTASTASAGGLYVALGDSYTSAPLVPVWAGSPPACLKSSGNYPNLVAQALGMTLRDVSCAGASTHHVFDAHGLFPNETNPPQIEGVTPDAQLVTIGLGGNDAGLVGVGLQCGELGYNNPTGHACRDYYTSGGVNSVETDINNTYPKMAQVIQAVHQHAPNARVLVIGYPDVTPHNGTGCYPLVPMSPDDLKFVDELLVKINAMLASVSAANNATFVDTFTPSIGHDVCKLVPLQWFSGLVPILPSAPLHPNQLGEASMASSTLKTLGKPVPSFIQNLITPLIRLPGLGLL